MVTLQEVKGYIGVDWSDTVTDARITRLIKVADKYLEGALGVSYPKEDERAVELSMIVIADLYENTSMNEKVSGSIRRLVNDFALQILVELRYTKVIITITSAPTSSGDITVALNGEETVIGVDHEEYSTVEELAALIRATTITGWTAESGDDEVVVLEKNYGQGSITPTFDGGTTGAEAGVTKA